MSPWEKFFKWVFLEYSCFTILCSFLLYSKVNQLYIYICPFFFSGIGNSNPFQYSRLENSIGRGAWRGYSPWSCKESDTTEHTCTYFSLDSIPIQVIQFSRSVMSNSLQSHGLQHSSLPCPSPTLRACSNSCPLSQWCHPTISSSVVPFSSCLQSFPTSGSFLMSQFFDSFSLGFPDFALSWGWSRVKLVITEYWIEFPVLTSRFFSFTYFIHSSVYMRSGLTFIPKSSFALKSQENPSFISTLALCSRKLVNRGWNHRRLRDVFWDFKKGVRKTKTNSILNHLYVESYKTQRNITMKHKQTHGHGEQTSGCQGERCWGKEGMRGWG